MGTGDAPQNKRTKPSLARIYGWFCALFLLLQGGSTLAARLVPAVDHAVPLLLATTRMQPAHSLLHIATALVALLALAAGARSSWMFAALFGGSYAALGAWGLLAVTANASELCGLPTGLGLQPFDHPFHVLLGGLGIAAAWRTPYNTDARAGDLPEARQVEAP